jgi:hypothetical protein
MCRKTTRPWLLTRLTRMRYDKVWRTDKDGTRKNVGGGKAL